jgi:hypothetical protein
MLRQACNVESKKTFHANLEQKVELCGTGVEGPNKANVFKRTIYQMILKIQMTQHEQCAGYTLVIPISVWDSWLRHLGRPHLERARGPDGMLLTLVGPDELHQQILESSRAWIFVFDIDRESTESPRPLKVIHKIVTSSAALVHYAFQTAADRAIANGVIDSYRKVLSTRIIDSWRGKIRTRRSEE